jgi:hypothetical protein
MIQTECYQTKQNNAMNYLLILLPLYTSAKCVTNVNGNSNNVSPDSSDSFFATCKQGFLEVCDSQAYTNCHPGNAQDLERFKRNANKGSDGLQRGQKTASKVLGKFGLNDLIGGELNNAQNDVKSTVQDCKLKG